MESIKYYEILKTENKEYMQFTPLNEHKNTLI